MYRIVNMGPYRLGQQASPATYGCPTPAELDAAAQRSNFAPPGAPSAFAVGVDPTLNCMRDARGNAICSDGLHYPPGCPKTPPDSYFSPGITPDVTTNGRIEGQIPPPKGGAPAVGVTPAGGMEAPSSGPNPFLMVGAGALGAAALATGAYFLFLK